MISVVIPAYNEELLIARCLDGLVNQKTTQDFEVIVVDNNSVDNTAKIASSYKSKLNITVIKELKKGRGPARARGFKHAKGSVIFSTDADCVVPSNWIEEFLRKLKNSNAVAVTGTIEVKDVGMIKNLLINVLHFPFMFSYKLVIGHYWLSGFSFAIYTDVYKKSGGFNTSINVQEDIDLSYKVSKLGKILLVTDTPVEFSGRRFKNGIFKGFLPYVQTYISYFWQKNENVILSDVR